MELRLYDTLTRDKRVFVPIDKTRVRMYVCGPTVYDFAHIGNARPVIVFDVLYRLLRHIYGDQHVTYVRNITDVDDKINARAAERGISIRELTEDTYNNFKTDVAALGCLPPTVEPRATEHIEEMKTIIERLIKSGNAYVAEDNVLFNVPSMPEYGELSKRPMDEMIAGSRVEVAPYKKDPQDFVLWKPSKPGEPGWPSPAGIKTPGRPGWHIECSAMAWKHLGETFDIHGGGIDLVFPHHENEIAQSRCAFHTGVMANYWMHNGFLQVEGEKMSKSAGNFFTIRQLLASSGFGGRKWSGPVLKFAMLQTHYRQPIDWTVRLLEQTEKRLDRWRNFAAERTLRRSNKDALRRFRSALCDDLNTPAAFAVIDDLIDEEKGSDEDRYTVYLALRQLGVKAKKTRIARTAEDFGKFYFRATRKPQEFWEFQSQATGNEGARLSVYLDVISDYCKSGVFRNLWFQGFEDCTIADLFNFQQHRKIKDEADQLERWLKELGHFSKNEWANIVSTVRERPVFISGALKPETKLLVVIRKLADFWEKKCSELDFSFEDLPELRERLWREIQPAESPLEAKIRRLIAVRDEARAAKDFKESDRIRDELAAMGVVLKDSKEGTTWEIAR